MSSTSSVVEISRNFTSRLSEDLKLYPPPRLSSQCCLSKAFHKTAQLTKNTSYSVARSNCERVHAHVRMRFLRRNCNTITYRKSDRKIHQHGVSCPNNFLRNEPLFHHFTPPERAGFWYLLLSSNVVVKLVLENMRGRKFCVRMNSSEKCLVCPATVCDQ